MASFGATASEAWVSVPGYEGLYEVSDWGRVRSARKAGWRILTGGRCKDGYPVMNFYKGGKRWSTPLHILVCLTFKGPKPHPHHEAAHLDGCRTNARADNLAWTTKAENHRHKRLHGTLLVGERHPRARLTFAQASEIKRRASLGENATAIAHEFEIAPTTVCDIRDGRRWKILAANPSREGAF